MGMLDTSEKLLRWAYEPFSLDASYHGELQPSERSTGRSLPFPVVAWKLKATEGKEAARKGVSDYEKRWLLREKTRWLPKSAR